MIQRSIQAGEKPIVIVRGGTDCVVEGYDGERVIAETESRWGGLNVRERGNAIEVNAGGACTVKVPLRSVVKVYSGKHASVSRVHGPVLINSGGDARATGVTLMEPCNAGGHINVDCDALTTDDAKFNAGKDIRIHVHTLADARIKVNDAGGYWEGVIGDGRATLRLKCGGAATLITEHDVRGKLLGNIERPA